VSILAPPMPAPAFKFRASHYQSILLNTHRDRQIECCRYTAKSKRMERGEARATVCECGLTADILTLTRDVFALVPLLVTYNDVSAYRTFNSATF